MCVVKKWWWWELKTQAALSKTHASWHGTLHDINSHFSLSSMTNWCLLLYILFVLVMQCMSHLYILCLLICDLCLILRHWLVPLSFVLVFYDGFSSESCPSILTLQIHGGRFENCNFMYDIKPFRVQSFERGKIKKVVQVMMCNFKVFAEEYRFDFRFW